MLASGPGKRPYHHRLSTTIKLVEAYGGSNCLELGHNATVNNVLVPKYRLCDRRIEEILDKGDDWVPLSDTGQGLFY
ncbi:hypothetical protein [Aquitalea sp. ASV11]|uniref:hypothetical protein n=1 Tax=Aquitalea sp. ASV11 TaxID=2795103 RepID=UPI0018ED94D8|nr:hypothetical protein [Aquitalea sp. ASV11]